MTETVVQTQTFLKDSARPGIDAIKRFWKPFVLIQLCGLCVVILYYTIPSFAGACEHIARLKKQYGYAFSGTAGIIAGAIVPEMFKVITMREEKLSAQRLKDLLFSCFYFCFMAMLCDGLYRLLDIIVGSEPTTRNAILKTLCDQGLFTPTLGTGIAATYFPLYRSGWDFKSIFKGFGFMWYLRTVLPCCCRHGAIGFRCAC